MKDNQSCSKRDKKTSRLYFLRDDDVHRMAGTTTWGLYPLLKEILLRAALILSQ